MDLLNDLMEEYRDALYSDNHPRIKRIGKLLRKRMEEVEHSEALLVHRKEQTKR